MSEPEAKTRRQQLEEMLREFSTDQQDAMVEFHQYLATPEGDAFVVKMLDFQQRTLPQSGNDQLFSGLLGAMKAINDIGARTVAEREAKAAAEEAARKLAEEAQAAENQPATN